MTDSQATHSTEYKKKVFSKMYQSSIDALEAEKNRPHKKIIPTSKRSGLREQFKQSFLPLLIDLFEMRQIAANYKTCPLEDPFATLKNKGKSPNEILKRLKEMQTDVEETKRWCEGIIEQLSKGMKEVTELLDTADKGSKTPHPGEVPDPGQPKNWLKRVLEKFRSLNPLLYTQKMGQK